MQKGWVAKCDASPLGLCSIGTRKTFLNFQLWLHRRCLCIFQLPTFFHVILCTTFSPSSFWRSAFHVISSLSNWAVVVVLPEPLGPATTHNVGFLSVMGCQVPLSTFNGDNMCRL